MGITGEDDKFCLPAMFLPPSFSFPLPLSAHHWRRLSGGHPPFSRLNALATVNILSPAPARDEQTDTNHCVDAMGRGKKRGVKDMLSFSFFFSFASSHDGKYENETQVQIGYLSTKQHIHTRLIFCFDFQQVDTTVTGAKRRVNLF